MFNFRTDLASERRDIFKKANNLENEIDGIESEEIEESDKIKIIIDELTGKFSFESNLMSYLNYNTKLLDYSLNENEIDLNFNEYLFDNTENKKVLEEVIYSISYSVKDNYDIDVINFFVNNEKIKY